VIDVSGNQAETNTFDAHTAGVQQNSRASLDDSVEMFAAMFAAMLIADSL
jgi:hypothetical protein